MHDLKLAEMFKPLWQHGRAIFFADGWYEWKKEGNKTAGLPKGPVSDNNYQNIHVGSLE
jgi:putative SOS response-associated peptidase YedK